MSGVTVKDNGAQALLARAREIAKGGVVRVGVLDDAQKELHEGEKPGPYTLLDVAAAHEFGAPAANVPQRSFIRATVDERREDIAKVQLELAKQVLAGKVTTDQALDLIGAKVAAMCQESINKGIEPALAPETVARKGSSKQLVDTGQLKSAITHRVYREG